EEMLDRRHDARVITGDDVLADEQLFVEFFALAHAGDPDLDVAVGIFSALLGQARHFNHRTGKIDNAHRLAHLEHENVTAARHRASLYHQLGGLGNQHEVPGDVGMRNGNRPAAFDLIAKKWHHRT